MTKGSEGIKPLSGSDGSADRLSPQISLYTRFERFAWDFAGVGALALALMTLMAVLLPGLAAEGLLLGWWAELLALWFGWGSLWVAVAAGVVGILLLRRRAVPRPAPERGASKSGAPKSGALARTSIAHPPPPPQPQPVYPSSGPPWGRIFALEVGAFATLALLAALGGTSLARADQGLDGGRVGWALSYLLGLLLNPLGLSGWLPRALIGTLFLVWGVIVGFGASSRLLNWLERKASEPLPPVPEAADEPGLGPAVSLEPLSAQNTLPVQSAPKKRVPLPPEFRKKLKLQPEGEESQEPIQAPQRDERLPALALLVNEQLSRPDERHINQTAGLIEKTLSEFGIPAKVVSFKIGPTVTQFAVEPGFLEKPAQPNGESEAARQKVRVAQIAALNRDLTLALAAQRLRIEAPVPGRPYIGIEVPNSQSTVVRLRPILESESFYRVNSPLAVALGRDVSGQPVVADLARMPHMLIAGTTGSGKSVGIASLTACLVMNNTPEDLRLVMIDPKMVELVRFNGLPHLFGKVETDIERILAVLRWTVVEMDRRYKLLEAWHARNIDSYNRRVRRRKGEMTLPRIVVLVDELADLMMTAPEQTEPALVRLAQLARAVGIHLVVATQRPSTDVVTGLIKANFPARISFAVASSIDSRVILDTVGAESLLGKGDMLFLPPDAAGPIRCQGVMISDQELERVITFWQKTAPKAEGDAAPWEKMMEAEAVLADRDDLVDQAIAVVRETQRASASLLQRRLRIGYPRAARLIDELEELGVIGPGGAREREVLLGKEDGSQAGDE
jgi:S-DNA-T family DNA segregation ATPase FtsK/SpoIIIE